MFGCMNFNTLVAGVEYDCSDDEMKQRIKAKFDKDFQEGLDLF